MAHFYGTVTGNRGTGARCGTKKSGMSAHIRGWDIGAAVELHHDSDTGKDVVRIYKTSGSHELGKGRELLGEFTE